MQLLGTITDCEINSIATSPAAAPTAFITAGSDGVIRYWDTRLKKKDVLAFGVPNAMGDTDILEVAWGLGGGAAAGDINTAYTIAGSVLSCVDVRKADIVAQHFYTNAYRVKGKAELQSMPVSLASFDASLKQHNLCGGNYATGASGNNNNFAVCDDEGEVYVVDPITCKPVGAADGVTPAVGTTYNGLLRPKPWKTVSCGFTTFNPTMGGGGGAASSQPTMTTFVCGMDNTLLNYRNSATTTTNASTSLYNALRGSKSFTTINMENLGGDDDEGGDEQQQGLAAAKSNTKGRKDITNPPIPTSFAPLTSSLAVDGMALVAIGRGDGSYVIIDTAPQIDAEEADAEEADAEEKGEGKGTAATAKDGWATIAVPEVAFVAQGHAHNTIGTCLWMPPSLVSSEIVSEYTPRKGCSITTTAPKVLVTIPTSGEVTMWDVTSSVMPMDEDGSDEAGADGDANDDDGGNPPALFACNVRGQGAASAKSLVNCGVLLSTAKGLLVGTSSGEMLMANFE